jgi:hypothetical protein
MKTVDNNQKIRLKKLCKRWFRLSLMEQMANIGSEVIRAIKWKNKGNEEYSKMAFERALELFDLTIQDPKNRHRLREVTRARELFADYLAGENIYKSSGESWEKYFYAFNYAARNTGGTTIGKPDNDCI